MEEPMINHFQRSSTILAGGAIIVLAILRAFGAFTPSLLVTFCISMATLTYSLIDLLLELKKDTSKRIIISLDLVAIGFLILSFATEGISKIFDIDKLSTPSEIVTLLAFGIVILIIGIQDRKSISETIRSIESKSYIDKKDVFYFG